MKKISDPKERTKRNYRLLALLIPLFAAVVIFGYAALFLFATERELPFFDCVWKSRLGIYCPGCGGSRALLALLRLDFASSLFYYPAMLPLALLLLDLYVRIVIAAVTGEERAVRTFRFRVFYLILAAVLLTCLVRNLLWLGFGIDVLGDLR